MKVKPLTWDNAIPIPSVVFVQGFRGRGKSALAHWLAERLHRKHGISGGIVGLPMSKAKLLPEWMKAYRTPTSLPEGVVAIIDESSMLFHSRRSQSSLNVLIDDLVGISRQRNQVIIFVTHYGRKLDLNILTDSDLVVFKEPSELHILFERREMRRFLQEAKEQLRKAKGDVRKWAWVVDFHNGRKALLKNGLPSYWCEELSNAYADLKNKGGKSE